MGQATDHLLYQCLFERIEIAREQWLVCQVGEGDAIGRLNR